MNNKEIAVLVPCYNEELTIAKVVTNFKKVLPEATIYVYDNNSKDDTDKVALKAGAVVYYEYRQGKGNVIRSMFRNIDADCYIMIDGDNTYPADHAREIANLILENKADMVIGDRLSSTYFTENKRAFHNFGNKAVRFLINKLFKNNVKDIMTGYRGFNKEFVKTFPIQAKGFEIETEMTINALDKNMRIKEIPVNYRDRPYGSKSKLNTIPDGIKVIKTIFSLFKDYMPLKFFGIFSFLTLTISVILFIPVFIEFFQTGLVLKFPTLFVSLVFLLIAVFSFFTGIILDVVNKKNRQLHELMITLNYKNIK